MVDRTALAGFGGSLASVSGSLHEVVGLVAGAMTIIYMAVKIYQEVKKKWVGIDHMENLTINIDQKAILRLLVWIAEFVRLNFNRAKYNFHKMDAWKWMAHGNRGKGFLLYRVQLL